MKGRAGICLFVFRARRDGDVDTEDLRQVAAVQAEKFSGCGCAGFLSPTRFCRERVSGSRNRTSPGLPVRGNRVNEPNSAVPTSAGIRHRPGMMLRPSATALSAAASSAKPSPLINPAARINGPGSTTPPACTGTGRYVRQRRDVQALSSTGELSAVRKNSIARRWLPAQNNEKSAALVSRGNRFLPKPGGASTLSPSNTCTPRMTVSLTFPRTGMPSNGVRPQTLNIRLPSSTYSVSKSTMVTYRRGRRNTALTDSSQHQREVSFQSGYTVGGFGGFFVGFGMRGMVGFDNVCRAVRDGLPKGFCIRFTLQRRLHHAVALECADIIFSKVEMVRADAEGDGQTFLLARMSVFTSNADEMWRKCVFRRYFLTNSKISQTVSSSACTATGVPNVHAAKWRSRSAGDSISREPVVELQNILRPQQY
ncbi:hypothetical protein CHS0354_018413 [Potamilus streckersoni]|uniref:Uncharacterized protein n=1 Tax=Potamilus streckersoni TaxID=2493646 RepID=A0AAE0TAJ4_9BIVA|nr:hypothetical protein CHS0354_018413 [Potamilus streckersoni]